MNDTRFINILLILLLATPAAVAKDDYFAPEWSETCRLNEHEFTIKFTSVSGDSSNDDMTISLTVDKQVSYELPIPKALYVKSGLHSKERNLCAADEFSHSNLAAIKIDNETVLLWISKDNRPSFNTLVLALLNIKSGKLLDLVDTDKMNKPTPPHSQNWIVAEDANSFKVRLIGEWLEIDDSLDSAIETWMKVSVKDNKIIFQEK